MTTKQEHNANARERAAALDAAVAVGYCVVTPEAFDRALKRMYETGYSHGRNDGRAEMRDMRH